MGTGRVSCEGREGGARPHLCRAGHVDAEQLGRILALACCSSRLVARYRWGLSGWQAHGEQSGRAMEVGGSVCVCACGRECG